MSLGDGGARAACGTSEDGQLRMNCDFPHRVLGHTFVHVLIPGCPQWLDPQHRPGALIKVNGLWGGRGVARGWGGQDTGQRHTMGETHMGNGIGDSEAGPGQVSPQQDCAAGVGAAATPDSWCP